ncbi:SIR2 family protein [Chryseobacterium sp.]|uniref:SIR2 family protein n=1 Tax=Chryseobacterium sp. TaxID=1871047 RepID=UPI00289DEDC2|nr:SIR2 family protein [Chryseobacterium sp.]
MEENLYLEYDAFLRSIKRNTDVPHSFLLGAGASISSGIQSAYDCIWEWKRDIYITKNINATEYYKNHKNEAVRKSIQKWLDNHGSYPALDSLEEYTFYAEKAHPIADDRRKYFFSLIENKQPYIGYKLLCFLAANGIVKSVWTTNFDGLVVRAAHQNNLTPIEITLDNAERIFRNQSTKELLCIALHGDYKYSTLKNTDSELDSQHEIFKEYLGNYHVDKNFIVAGYSGRDRSLMDALKSAYSKKGSGRLYWCGYGEIINDEVRDLLTHIRAQGREAYYISTDGFDKMLIHLSKTVFEDNEEFSERIQKILESTESETATTDFKLDFRKTDKYIKSNLHPIVFPKEVFQFQIDFGNEKPWAFLRTLTAQTSIVAVPFKGNVYALGTLSEINSVFKPHLKSEIKREAISRYDIENVSSFKNLMLTAVCKFLYSQRNVGSNYRDKIWLKDVLRKDGDVTVHKAIFVSLYFDKNPHFGYLAFSPTVYLDSELKIDKTQKQRISKNMLEKLFNNKYNEELEFWNGILFNYKKLKFEYPPSSGTGFEFQISSNTAFGEIDVIDNKYRSYVPQNYDNRRTQFKGIQFLEPQLIFKNIASDNDFRDYHPMRGLINNRPYDVNLNGLIHSNEVNLSVICPQSYSERLFMFLSELNAKHSTANINTDYLIDYPGFLSAFNLPINIPATNDGSSWMDINFIADSSKKTHENAIKLARAITDKIEKISVVQSSSTIVIFIPFEWQPFETYVYETETFDLHDYIKAFAASKGISTQLIHWTISSNARSTGGFPYHFT